GPATVPCAQLGGDHGGLMGAASRHARVLSPVSVPSSLTSSSSILDHATPVHTSTRASGSVVEEGGCAADRRSAYTRVLQSPLRGAKKDRWVTINIQSQKSKQICCGP